MDQNEAWVVGMIGQGPFIVEHTSDGGNHWQSSQFSDENTGKDGIADAPHFINRQDGWLDVQRNFIMGAQDTINDVFYTTDGGNH